MKPGPSRLLSIISPIDEYFDPPKPLTHLREGKILDFFQVLDLLLFRKPSERFPEGKEGKILKKNKKQLHQTEFKLFLFQKKNLRPTRRFDGVGGDIGFVANRENPFGERHENFQKKGGKKLKRGAHGCFVCSSTNRILCPSQINNANLFNASG